jgi:hypothetical protein
VRPLRINPISGQNFQEPLIILRQYPGVVTNSASIPLVRAKGFGALPILLESGKSGRLALLIDTGQGRALSAEDAMLSRHTPTPYLAPSGKICGD